MNETTMISDTKTTINSTQNAAGFRIVENKKVLFLPIEISKTFPALEIIEIRGCAITLIGPENFDGLTKLKSLFLRDNQITHIPSGTFTTLESLYEVDMSKLSKKNLLNK